MTYKTVLLCLTFFSLTCPQLWAAPFLRIHVPEATRISPNALESPNGDQLPVWIPSGTNGPGNIFFEAWNSGDGNLNLQVDGGFSPWLQPRLSGSQACSFDPGRSCQIIDVFFDSAGLPNGTFQGSVTVSDPSAMDSPQRVPVTIHVGGTIPERIDLYTAASPGSTDEFSFQTPTGPSPTVRVSPAGQYLSVSSSGLGSFRFVHQHLIRATVTPGMGAGDQQGSVEISGSTFAADNRNVPLTLHITNGPIASPSQSAVRISAIQGGDTAIGQVELGNRGGGTLSVSSVEVETASGGDWLSVEDGVDGPGGIAFRINAAIGALDPGLYMGTARFNTNAANSPLAVPVEFELHASGPPEVFYKGVVNAAGFEKVPGIAAGTLVSLFGTQLAPSVEGATSIPLPTELVSTSVKVNGIDAPLIFVSSGQINFQVPFEVGEGSGLVQVVREGQAGNTVSATVLNRSPGIFRFGIGEYGVIVNASQGNFPLPPAVAPPGLNAAPARPGDVLVIYATGLGPVTPEVRTGEAAASAEPLNRSVDIPGVQFSLSPFGLESTPFFAGMTPGFVGLFQINVFLHQDLTTNPRTPITLDFGDGRRSNTVDVAVEK